MPRIFPVKGGFWNRAAWDTGQQVHMVLKWLNNFQLLLEKIYNCTRISYIYITQPEAVRLILYRFDLRASNGGEILFLSAAAAQWNRRVPSELKSIYSEYNLKLHP